MTLFDDTPSAEDIVEANQQIAAAQADWDPADLPESQQQLLDDLQAAGAPEEMQEAVRDGWYHDYVSQHPFPKNLLVQHAEKGGLHEIAQRAKRGDYDP